MSAEILQKIKESDLKLLVADDEPVIQQSLKKVGELLGLEVVTVGDGQEAWDSFGTEMPDLVITDIYMPKMNGLTLLNKIKEGRPDCPVILITGYTHYQQLTRNDNGLKFNPDGFMTKPFELKKVVQEIVKLISTYGLVI
ncbi:hypothetical protein CEE37_02245 [candidate division LCP-89 bacterium B3_LCP]|uniref:Response regulatory domain-containing protein n=1 Tax=candidate division LCP-89 bacterium B3_LCP TaxID=2012998 RepID=A0A532V5R6_UNCL8|nr:MAG: hypothetical protein CEE37_02245 [candidate division LCP-89 bacterium B3_LCP]